LIHRFSRSIMLLLLPCMFLSAVTQSLSAGEIEELNFARKLSRDGLHIAAAEEFLRFAERYPASPRRAEALAQAGEAYMKAGKANEALAAFDSYLDSYAGQTDACRVRYYRGRILKALKRYAESADEFILLADTYIECGLVDQALLEAGDCLLSVGEVPQATSVLRRLVYGRESSEVTPRGMLSLSLALERGGRDLEASEVLQKILETYPTSPVTALALLNLAGKASAAGEFDAALSYLSRVEERFEELALRERAALLAIEIHAGRGDDERLYSETVRFIDRFAESARRGEMYATAVRTAWRLGRNEELLKLMNSFRSEDIFEDPSGEMRLLESRALAARDEMERAIGLLGDFGYDHPRSPLLTDAYRFEADLLYSVGRVEEARRIYGSLLLESLGDAERGEILERMAEISAVHLSDTTSALAYWTMVLETEGELEEKALFRVGSFRESMGDGKGAVEAFARLLERFPHSEYAETAGRAVTRIELRPAWTSESAGRLAEIAVSGEDAAHRAVRAGIVAVEEAGDPYRAVDLLERGLRSDLPDSIRGMAKYELGVARDRISNLLEATGKDHRKEHERALSLWLETAREFVGTRWGGKAHRAYIEGRFDEWSDSDRLARIDEYLSFYGEGEGRWWANQKKVEFLYDLAQKGDSLSLDRALSLSVEIAGSRAPKSVKREAALRRGYLYRISGDTEAAAAAFEDFVSRYGDDARRPPILYDLGETYLEQKNYDRAARAYKACLEEAVRRELQEKAMLRMGDSYYYARRFGEAASTYAEFSGLYTSSHLAGEALFREALAREMLGEKEKAETIIESIALRDDLSRRLQAKILRKRGERFLLSGDFQEAERQLEELVSMERSYENTLLLARARLGAGGYERAVEGFTRALRFEDADSCSVLSARARANLRRGELGRARRDMDELERRCSASSELAGVLLERGVIEAEEGECSLADSTLTGLRRSFPGTTEAEDALYYLAVCDMKRGGYERAVERLEAFLRNAPQSELAPEAYFKLAGAHFTRGNPNLAARNYALAAESFDDPEKAYLARRNLGNVYQELEDWEKAADTWKDISEIHAGHDGAVEALFNLGFCYNQTGRHELAYGVYKRIPDVAVSDEQRGRSHYWAGVSLKNLGQYAEAVREFLRVPYLKTGGMWGVTSKLEAAACYERLQETGEALKIYRDVIRAHGRTSDWGRVAAEAEQRITGETPGREGSSGGGEDRRDGP
jgi:TolA-binding protein